MSVPLIIRVVLHFSSILNEDLTLLFRSDLHSAAGALVRHFDCLGAVTRALLERTFIAVCFPV